MSTRGANIVSAVLFSSGKHISYLSNLVSVPLALLWSHDSMWLLTTSTAAGVSRPTPYF